ncbi:MAG: Gfo/Idh/MocA family oxidoreductase [Verrucomicrobiota bacterium]|nr:Gfo/Idh/MocA family oxidoreductase [Verrucomicrobiota bacterium]
MSRRRIRFGLIGLGLMGREFASAVSRWCHLDTQAPVPEITSVCDVNSNAFAWFRDNVPSARLAVTDYRELLASKEVDAIYCAIPHNLRRQVYADILNAGKHLLGEKPFGMDRKANAAILQAVRFHPDLVVRCSSEFPYFPACKRLIQWAREGAYGRLVEARSGFLHSSDMNPRKPVNWKRMASVNGAYGCMGDLGMHTHHVPLRLGWLPFSVYADLQKIVKERPDGKGGTAACDTWDNALLLCRARDRETREEFTVHFETRRMAPGETNTWYLEIYGTRASARFSTKDPKALHVLENMGKEQGWIRLETGSQSFIPSITGSIFEFGFSDAFQQMIGAFLEEFAEGGPRHPFPNVTPGETVLSHALLTAALESHAARKAVEIRLDSES